MTITADNGYDFDDQVQQWIHDCRTESDEVWEMRFFQACAYVYDGYPCTKYVGVLELTDKLPEGEGEVND